MVSRRLVNSSVVFLLVVLSCNFIQSLNPAGENPSASGVALLNEVLFLPAQGESAFVELKSSGGQVALGGLYLVNERGESYSLPGEFNDLAFDQFLLILFDGTDRVEDKTIHSGLGGFLDPNSGFLELYASDGTLLDRAAWGPGQPASVKLTRGGIISDLEPGTSIGRFPLSVQPDPLEWTVFSPTQATPGAANPQPGVEVMIPLNGAVITQTSFDLSWYPVPGATQYTVQVAGSEAFDAPVVDETVAAPELDVQLSPGMYFWRVQAIAEGGGIADFSPTQTFSISPTSSISHLAAPRQQTSLAVPFLSQHKDTQMILLESKNEEGEHAWDVAHPGLDRNDPADYGNCALASIAMVNAFYGGDLSQDRIGFEVFHDTLPGPEYDLMYGQGLYPDQTTQALAFALDSEPVFRPQPETLDILWVDVQLAINADAPIVAAQLPGHAFVITGYYEDNTTRFVMINDPWWGQYAVDIAGVRWKYYWMTSPDSIPVLNDPEIGMDSDGDGIVDFDEINRFGTNPNDRDTDKDSLEDKDDLRASIYDEQWGYALASLSFLGRDYDNDGVKMELDEDSDGGGCFDGMEDFDLDGKYKEPETWNFDEEDDACFWGTEELYLENTWVTSDGSHHQILRTYVKFSLHAIEEGKLEGLAQITYTHTGEFNYPECSGTHDIGTQFFQATLAGEFQKLADGSTFVGFRAAPDHGEPYTIQWIMACSGAEPPNEQQDGWTWGGSSGTLKDGVFDYYQDFSTADFEEFWQKVHIEQGQGME